MRQLASRAVVLLLAAYALLGVYGGATALWQPPGTIGLTTDYGATVRAVDPGGPAARAGIVAGDGIRLDVTPFDQRRFVSGPGTTIPVGTTVVVKFTHDGVARDVRLTAVAGPLSAPARAALLFMCLASLVFVGIGTALIFLRPSYATWGFGLYCLLEPPTAMYTLPWPTAGLTFGATIVYDVVQNAGAVGLLLFVLSFPRAYDVPWRNALRNVLPLAFAVLVAMTLYPDIANDLLARGAEIENRFLQAAFGLVFVVAMLVMTDTNRRIEKDERERIRWVLVGFAFGLVGSYIGNTLIFSSAIAETPPLSLTLALMSCNVLLPLTVAYAVVRHRVIEIRFVIGRALVFVVLTTLLAALFALLDYVFGTVLEDFRLSRIIAAAISLAIAFTFKWLEERLNHAIEQIFFRKRHLAEARLARAAHALPQARSDTVVEATLIGEAADAIGLASAALFREDRDGRFARTAAAGWSDAECAALDDTDLLVLALRSEGRIVDLNDFTWRRTDVPRAGSAPAVAVPVQRRGELVAFALYGGHADGSALEADEVELLERLAYAAGIAFDQLEALQLREENERQRATIGDLTARLDELRGGSNRPARNA